MKIFVPGRICLFGEHSDWAGGYRRVNSKLEKGCTIVVGTNQGIHAEVKPHPNKLKLTVTLDDGTRKGPFEVPMEKEALLSAAEQGGFFSYVSGVAYQVLTHYKVGGLEIDNYYTDLPTKKGLSSSAAVCVMIARAFNRIYDLKMTIRGEMEYAYLGEITTPSRCGRMDQGCAYGDRPILMTFDGDRIDVKEMKVREDIFLVIVDLCASKDTKEILTKLNSCYPFADNEIQRNVQNFLGPISSEITSEDRQALEVSDAECIGELMCIYQEEFDKNLQPACPSQLTAPVLHKVLNCEEIKPFVLGGKGVGSQGDGTAQFIVRDEESQNRVVEIIENSLRMKCLKLTVKSTRKVRKAVIPAAGFGTRLFPSTKVLRKEFFPIIDSDGRTKPLLLSIVEEALSAGVEEIAVIVQQSDFSRFEEFFKTPLPIENYNKLQQDDRKYSEYLLEIGRKITFIVQESQEGFGHAVYTARDWVGDEPFLLLLGDHLYVSSQELSCARQLIDVYQQYNVSSVALTPVPSSEVGYYGCVTGSWMKSDRVLTVSEIAEKPTLGYAREHLTVEGIEHDTFLSLFGLYILKPIIFDFLEECIRRNNRKQGEIHLTSCLERMRQEEGMLGSLIDGYRYDISNPEAYRNVINSYRG